MAELCGEGLPCKKPRVMTEDKTQEESTSPASNIEVNNLVQGIPRDTTLPKHNKDPSGEIITDAVSQTATDCNERQDKCNSSKDACLRLSSRDSVEHSEGSVSCSGDSTSHTQRERTTERIIVHSETGEEEIVQCNGGDHLGTGDVQAVIRNYAESCTAQGTLSQNQVNKGKHLKEQQENTSSSQFGHSDGPVSQELIRETNIDCQDDECEVRQSDLPYHEISCSDKGEHGSNVLSCEGKDQCQKGCDTHKHCSRSERLKLRSEVERCQIQGRRSLGKGDNCDSTNVSPLRETAIELTDTGFIEMFSNSVMGRLMNMEQSSLGEPSSYNTGTCSPPIRYAGHRNVHRQELKGEQSSNSNARGRGTSSCNKCESCGIVPFERNPVKCKGADSHCGAGKVDTCDIELCRFCERIKNHDGESCEGYRTSESGDCVGAQKQTGTLPSGDKMFTDRTKCTSRSGAALPGADVANLRDPAINNGMDQKLKNEQVSANVDNRALKCCICKTDNKKVAVDELNINGRGKSERLQREEQVHSDRTGALISETDFGQNMTSLNRIYDKGSDQGDCTDSDRKNNVVSDAESGRSCSMDRGNSKTSGISGEEGFHETGPGSGGLPQEHSSQSITEWYHLNNDLSSIKPSNKCFELTSSYIKTVRSQGNINILPETVLLQVFRYLSPCTLLRRVGCVCRYWYNLCRDPSLWRNVSLKNQQRLTDTILLQILSFSDRVLKLNLTDCGYITDSGIRDILSKCHHLQMLSLMRCFDITDKGFEGLGQSKQSSRLQSLHLDGCCKITDKTILQVADSCPDLRSLHLNQCNKVTDRSISKMADRCPRLSQLLLDNCIQVTDVGLEAVIKNCPHLSYLNIMSCRITDVSLKLVSHLTDLTILDVSNIVRLTPESVKFVSRHCQKLKSVNLSLNSVMNDDCVSTLARNLPQLDRLLCVSCNISDKGLEDIAAYRPTIKSLDVSWCQEITDHGVRVISQACPNLDHFGLIRCDRVTLATIEELVEQFPKVNYSTFLFESRRLLERARHEGFNFDLQSFGVK